MELHPYLEIGASPRAGLWYVLPTEGDGPSNRVGHTASFIGPSPGTASTVVNADDEDSQDSRPGSRNGKIYLIGGANPEGAFAETFLLDLEHFAWSTVETPPRTARYEHAVGTTPDHKIFVFGGATKCSSINDVACLDLIVGRWCDLPGTPGGRCPSPRTQHSACATPDGRLVVYSGGQTAAEPVNDRQVYIYSPSTNAWTVLPTSGSPPKPRHGHLTVFLPSQGGDDSGTLYLHGGMAQTTFYGDLHKLEIGAGLLSGSWSEIQPSGGRAARQRVPCARAAHGGVALNRLRQLVLFGGMAREGALDDMHIFNTVTKQWSPVEYSGPPPPRRLDFASCLITLDVMPTSSTGQDDVTLTAALARETGSVQGGGDGDTEGQNHADADTQRTGDDEVHGAQSDPSTKKRYSMLFVHGGMDTQGEIFNDAFAFLLDEEDVTSSNDVLGDSSVQ